MEKTVTTVRLYEWQREALEAASEQEDVPVAILIRRGVELFLAGRGVRRPKVTRRREE